MDISYVKKIQKWVEMDNKVVQSKSNIQNVVEEKKDLESDIIDYVKNNSLENMNITITDGSIKFLKKSSTQTLNSKLLNELLNKFFQDNDISPNFDINKACEFVFSNLTVKTSFYIKRNMNSPSQ